MDDEETFIEDQVQADLLLELVDEDRALTEAELALRRAKTQWEVASTRYSGIRDITTRTLGFSPYGRQRTRLRLKNEDSKDESYSQPLVFASRGRFRYLNMTPGDAVIAVLRNSRDPMTLDEIIVALREGGMAVGLVPPRAINAALLNKPGIHRSEDGRYVPNDLGTLEHES